MSKGKALPRLWALGLMLLLAAAGILMARPGGAFASEGDRIITAFPQETGEGRTLIAVAGESLEEIRARMDPAVAVRLSDGTEKTLPVTWSSAREGLLETDPEGQIGRTFAFYAQFPEEYTLRENLTALDVPMTAVTVTSGIALADLTVTGSAAVEGYLAVQMVNAGTQVKTGIDLSSISNSRGPLGSDAVFAHWTVSTSSEAETGHIAFCDDSGSAAVNHMTVEIHDILTYHKASQSVTSAYAVSGSKDYLYAVQALAFYRTYGEYTYAAHGASEPWLFASDGTNLAYLYAQSWIWAEGLTSGDEGTTFGQIVKKVAGEAYGFTSSQAAGVLQTVTGLLTDAQLEDGTEIYVYWNGKSAYQTFLSLYEAPHTPRGQIRVTKQSGDPDLTGKLGDDAYQLAGAQYGVYAARSQALADTGRLDTVTIQADGTGISILLDPGTYYVKEVVPGAGYLLDGTIYAVQVTGTSESPYPAAEVVSAETPMEFGLTLQKQSADPEFSAQTGAYSLEGAEYTLYTCPDSSFQLSNANVYGTYRTGQDGTLTISRLPLYSGYYYLLETGLPQGAWLLNETPIRIQVWDTGNCTLSYRDSTGTERSEAASGTVFSVTQAEQPIRWSLQVQKTGTEPADTPVTSQSAAYSLKGAEYLLFTGTSGDLTTLEQLEKRAERYTDGTSASNSAGHCNPAATDASGLAVFQDLPLLPEGECYYLAEFRSSPGYGLDPSVWRIQVTDHKDGTVTIQTTQQGTGAVSALRQQACTAGVWISRTISSGEPAKSFSLSLAKTSGHSQVTEANKCYSLKGAEYTLYRSSTGCLDGTETVWATYTTDAKGEFATGSLPLNADGEYYLLAETAPSPGYGQDPTVWRLHIADQTGGDLISTEIASSQNGIDFARTDSKTDVPDASVVELASQEPPVTDPDGIHLWKEQQIPNRYDYDLSDAEFTVTFYGGQYTMEEILDGLPEQEGTVQRTWVLRTSLNHYAELSWRYLTEDSDALFLDSSGEVCLPLGTLTIQETLAPYGFLPQGAFLDQDGQEIAPAVPGDGQQGAIYLLHVTEGQAGTSDLEGGSRYTMVERLQFGSLKLQKQTPSGDGIGGAEFRVELQNPDTGDWVRQAFSREETGSYRLDLEDSQSPDDTLVTDGSGELVLTGLPFGTYRITEIRAPEGYSLLKEPLVVHLPVEEAGTEAAPASGSGIYTFDGIDYRVDLVYRIQEVSVTALPFTGGPGPALWWAAGGLTLAAAAVLLFGLASVRVRCRVPRKRPW